MFKLILFIIFSITFLNTPFAYAYIGPGMGGGVIAAVLGIIIGILCALFGIIYFPLKRYFKKRKEEKNKKNN